MRLEMSISEAEALADSLRERRRLIDRMELEWAADAARLATADHHRLEGSEKASDFLRHHCQMGEGAVKDRLAVGSQLHKLWESATAMRNGEIGFPHLVQMAHTASAVWRAATTTTGCCTKAAGR